ncbi:MAG: ATP synthase F1 subunit epsilon [Bacteroidales bacterium]|jgi:F-type H+-transporting ATPase subunit epsilon|nr:ATP synthase F1 subunit epsilon [Bacteroidales bacterium]
MQLEILTPSKNIFSGEVKLVKVPGSNGSFEILNNHAAIISTLTDGEVKVEAESGETLRYKTSGGVVEVKNNHIVVLAESIEK